MGNRFIIKTGITIILSLSSCIGWNDREVPKEYQINNEYKINYWKFSQREIESFSFKDVTNGGIEGSVIELIYNDSYIYYMRDTTIWEKCYEQLKIDLESSKIGDYIRKSITKKEYNEFKSLCKDCIILNLDSLNKMDKDIPPIIMGRKQE